MEKNNTLQLGATYGLILGIAMCMVTLVPFLAGMKPDENKWLSIVGLGLMVVFFVVAINKQKQLNGGFISFGKAFKLGMTAGVVAAIVAGLYMVFHTTQLVPDFQATAMESAREAMEKSNPDITEEQIDMALGMTEKFTSPKWIGLFTFISNIFPALLFALLVAAFLKKDAPPFLEDSETLDAKL